MSTTQLKKGPLKVITFAPAEIFRENELRTRVGGKIFHPAVHVAVEPKEGDARASGVFRCFAVNLPKGATIKSTFTKFPYEWAGLRNAPRYWIETTDAVEIDMTSP